VTKFVPLAAVSLVLEGVMVAPAGTAAKGSTVPAAPVSGIVRKETTVPGLPSKAHPNVIRGVEEVSLTVAIS
jgi:hypothetical protein